MTEELPGDPASPSGSRPTDRAAAGVSPLRASIPIAESWEATYERAANPSARLSDMLMECADLFAATLETTDERSWRHLLIYAPHNIIRERAQGIEAQRAETAQQAPCLHESPVASAMRPDDPATTAALQRQLAEADAVIWHYWKESDFNLRWLNHRDGAIARHEARKR